MELSRRRFLYLCGLTAPGIYVSGAVGFLIPPPALAAQPDGVCSFCGHRGGGLIGAAVEGELAQRRAALPGAAPVPERGYARLYAREILGADEGCDFAFLRPGPAAGSAQAGSAAEQARGVHKVGLYSREARNDGLHGKRQAAEDRRKHERFECEREAVPRHPLPESAQRTLRSDRKQHVEPQHRGRQDDRQRLFWFASALAPSMRRRRTRLCWQLP